MSRTIYDLMREANWLCVEHAGFGSTLKVHVTYNDFTRTEELPYNAGPVATWETALRLQAELIKDCTLVAQVTKELTQ